MSISRLCITSTSILLRYSFTFFLFSFAFQANAGLIIQRPMYIGLTEGLVGYWSFDGPDMSQSTNNVWALDRSGNNNIGRLTNMATSTARKAGKIGQALEFDGSDDYVDAGSGTSLDNIVVKTLSVWIKPRSLGESNNGIIFRKIDGLGNGWLLFLCSNGVDCSGTTNTITYYHVSSDNARWNPGANVLNMNEWMHLVLIYDNSSASNDPVFYINGVLKTTTEVTSPIGASADESDASFLIGNNNSTTNTFDGFIDEVRVYNRALSGDEIKRLYKIGSTFVVNKPRTDTLKEGLVGYWSFDGPDMAKSGAGTETAFDRSGNANNGTLTNGPVRKAGKIGQALDFDGVNDSVIVSDSNSLDINGTPGAISVWIKRDNIGSWHGIIAKGTGNQNNNQNYACEIRNTNTVMCISANDDSTIDSVTTISANTWYHLVYTWNTSTESIYINGVLDNSEAKSGVILDNSGSLRIGEFFNNDYFDGLIDEVRVYNRALSEQEIKRLYNMGR